VVRSRSGEILHRERRLQSPEWLQQGFGGVAAPIGPQDGRLHLGQSRKDPCSERALDVLERPQPAIDAPEQECCDGGQYQSEHEAEYRVLFRRRFDRDGCGDRRMHLLHTCERRELGSSTLILLCRFAAWIVDDALVVVVPPLPFPLPPLGATGASILRSCSRDVVICFVMLRT